MNATIQNTTKTSSNLTSEDILRGQQLITKTDLAVFFNVKERTIDSWMQRGLVGYIKIGRTVRFNLEQVKASLANLSHGPK